MRKLLNTIYVTSPDSYLSLDGENIVILSNNVKIGRFPLHNIEGIVSFTYSGASPSLMGYCAKNNISMCFMTPNGRFLARVIGKSNGNVILRKEQYARSADINMSTDIARNFVLAKIYNSKWVLERATRDYQYRVDTDKLKAASTQLSEYMILAKETKNLEELRGYEGKAAVIYFSCLDDLILNQKEAFYFRERNKRPPLDNFNCVLSFMYSVLSNEIASSLEAVGLDSYVGFLHRDRSGRISLALDMVEELRSIIADRFVISLINKQQIKPNGFTKMESGAVIMDDATRKVVLTAWQSKKQEEIMHPFLSEKITWGLVPFSQAMLLARYLRGDLDEYPPFFWK